MTKGTLRQILLITDGCSNAGGDPVATAALAYEQGITVNVIGVVENDAIGDQGVQEIEAIARSGGGISQIVYAKQLAQTVQMVTQKAMTQTIYSVVNKQLSSVLGDDKEMDDLPPEKRGKVMNVVDELGETLDMALTVVVDTSASMKRKLPTVQEALVDLSVSLESRQGDQQFSLLVYPWKKKETKVLLKWTPKLQALNNVFDRLTSGGVTPTGPALREAIRMFSRQKGKKDWRQDEWIEESGS